MKRGVFDLLRRGFDNTLANWQLSLIRFLEAIVFMAIAFAALLAILMPILVAAGIHFGGIDTPEEIESLVTSLLAKWLTLVWILVGVTVMLLLFIVIHAFVEAGNARVFVDADRTAGPAIAGTRSRYRLFSFERWMAGATSGFWPVFWIYNIVWGVAGVILLIPLLPTLALMIAFRNEEAVLVLSGCFGLAITVMLAIVVGLISALVANRAITAWAAHRTDARESIGIGWRAIKGDFGRHYLTALAIMVVGMAASMFFASFNMFAGFGEAIGSRNDAFMIMTMPVRFIGSILNSAFSSLLGSWYLATYAALAVDPK